MRASKVDVPFLEHKEDAKAKRVVLVDKNGEVIDASNPLPVSGGGSGGGGVQYTEGDVDESITGTAALAEGPSNVLYPLQLDENGFLKVNVVAGGAGGGVAQTQVRDSSNNWKDVGYYTNNLYMPVSIQADNTGTKDVNVTNTSITVTASDFDIRNLDSSTDSVSAVQSGSWSVTVSNVVTVTATDFDIRDLSYTSDSVSAYQAGTWNINNIVETVDVNVTNTSITVTATDLDIRSLDSSSDSVSAVQSGDWSVSVSNTVTVQATDFDIRSLDYNTDSVTVFQGGSWSGVGVNLDVDNVGLAKDRTSATSFHSVRVTDGYSFIDPRDRNWTITETVNTNVTNTVTVTGSVTVQEPLSIDDNGGSITVDNANIDSLQFNNDYDLKVTLDGEVVTITATDLDIRSLSYSTDSVTVYQAGSWSVDVSNVVTVQATDLDIRSLDYNSDSVSVYKAGSWSGLGVNIDVDNVGLAKEHTTSTSPHSVRISDGLNFIDPRDRNWTITETVSTSVTNTVTVQATDLDVRDLDYNTDSVTSYQGGSWTVSVGNTVTVTATDLDVRDLSYSTDSVTSYQGGTWNVNSIVNPVTVQATDLDIRNLSHSNDSISAYQAGSWNVGKNQYTTLLAYDSNGNLEYVGFASPGSSSSQAVWRIIKLSYDANGNLVSVKYADGNDNFDNVWDDRESYSYS